MNNWTDEVICPHCNESQGTDWEDEEQGENTCEDCGCRFNLTIDYDVSYCTTPLESTKECNYY